MVFNQQSLGLRTGWGEVLEVTVGARAQQPCDCARLISPDRTLNVASFMLCALHRG